MSVGSGVWDEGFWSVFMVAQTITLSRKPKTRPLRVESEFRGAWGKQVFWSFPFAASPSPLFSSTQGIISTCHRLFLDLN